MHFQTSFSESGGVHWVNHRVRQADRPWRGDPAGRTLIVTKADVFAVSDDEETLCTAMQQTIMVMHGKRDRA
ncbi:hypothetical protein [Burkholderia sp. LMG 32019]|uniref:hypothetical protein n=1 Tax=Burkholderia sp. LMG 32019 TaxID=3158173 RepID=UPI003C2AFC32